MSGARPRGSPAPRAERHGPWRGEAPAPPEWRALACLPSSPVAEGGAWRDPGERAAPGDAPCAPRRGSPRAVPAPGHCGRARGSSELCAISRLRLQRCSAAGTSVARPGVIPEERSLLMDFNCVYFNVILGSGSADDLSVLYSNRAACHLKEGNCSGCIEDCNR